MDFLDTSETEVRQATFKPASPLPVPLRIVIPGGAGDMGRLLARHFHKAGHDVVVLSRRKHAMPWRSAVWSGSCDLALMSEIEGADVVINLAGRTVNCRYTEVNRREIMESRVNSTRAVALAIAQAERPPKVWLQASTATLYAHRYDAANDEATGLTGGHEPDAPAAWHFSIDVVKAWERAAVESTGAGRTRLVLLRTSIAMMTDGGAFPVMHNLARFGLGGTIGSGRQYMSWIHQEDFVRSVEEIIANDSLIGPVNLASPYPLPNKDFMRHLRAACGVPIGLPCPELLLAVGTFLLQTEPELVLKSRRVVPGKLLKAGFQFRYLHWEDAARDLCQRWRCNHA
ncbi:MAG: TIGR01777 family oxidoreductase [Candidatus Methylacidiphilales bacterium]